MNGEFRHEAGQEGKSVSSKVKTWIEVPREFKAHAKKERERQRGNEWNFGMCFVGSSEPSNEAPN